jgi:hypothetical protein
MLGHLGLDELLVHRLVFVDLAALLVATDVRIAALFVGYPSSLRLIEAIGRKSLATILALGTTATIFPCTEITFGEPLNTRIAEPGLSSTPSTEPIGRDPRARFAAMFAAALASIS